MFASKESDSKIKYDEQLVQGLFPHALETCLVDYTIQAKVRPLLKNNQVADEQLIEGMSSAMVAESERAAKFNFTGRWKSAPKVAAIGTGSTSKPAEPLTTYEREMLATLKSIKTESYTVQSEVATLRTKVEQKDSENKELSLPQVKNRKDHVNKLVHAYNCTKHGLTGFSPFLLLFGRPSRLPVDLMYDMSAKKENHLHTRLTS